MSEPSTLRDVRDKRRAERLSGRTRPDYMTVIVEATERVLAETPFHKVTIDQILNEAQVSRATFYAYFSSKVEVVAEVLSRVMLELFDLLSAHDKRLHAYPGQHADNGPEAFEVQAAFLKRYLERRASVP